ncbi:hypothetical protein ACMD2_06190, partial [Ananas comosus]
MALNTNHLQLLQKVLQELDQLQLQSLQGYLYLIRRRSTPPQGQAELVLPRARRPPATALPPLLFPPPNHHSLAGAPLPSRRNRLRRRAKPQRAPSVLLRPPVCRARPEAGTNHRRHPLR